MANATDIQQKQPVALRTRKYLTILSGSIGALFAGQANSSPAAPPSVPATFATGSAVHFKLIQGRGIAVCEAYLDLLNRAKYTKDAFCGRPNNDPAHGFADLKRRDLTANEIASLFNKVHEFVYFGDQYHPDRTFHPNGTPGKQSFWSTEFATGLEIRNLLKIHGISAWTFTAPIDIDNDGVPDSVLLWQGYPVDDKDAACGSVYPSRAWDFGYVRQRAFILMGDGRQIDEDRTRTIFGTPAQATQGPVGREPFHPLSDSIGIFQFGSRYYIETGNFPKSPDSGGIMIVYLREHGQTQRMCKLRY